MVENVNNVSGSEKESLKSDSSFGENSISALTEVLGGNIKPIYEKAVSLLSEIGSHCAGTQERFFFDGKNLRKVDRFGGEVISAKEDDFEFVLIELNSGGDRGTQGGQSSIKIMKKPIKFTFTIRKNDPEDLHRMQFVYDVTMACKGNELLLPLAKKVKPDWQKIEKKFPQKKDLKDEYNSLNIHDKTAVITLINKLLK